MTDDPRRSPLVTVAHLAVWSIVVGVVLSALGITPYNLVERLSLLARRVYDLGFGALHWGLQYFLLGAVIVVPVWLISVLLRGRGRS